MNPLLRRTWLAFALVAALLGGLIAYVMHTHHLEEDRAAEQQFEQQLEWLTLISRNWLHSGDFVALNQAMTRWAEKDPRVAELSLTANNGFAIARFARPLPPGDRLTREVVIPFGYDNSARLYLEVDDEAVHHVVHLLSWRVAALYFAFLLLAGILLHQRLRRQREAAELREQRSQLRATNLALEAEMVERHAAQRQLEHVLEEHRLILESTAEGIYGMDREGRCTFVNDAALRLLGYASRDDIVGRPIHALIHHTRTDGSPYPADACRAFRALADGRAVMVDDEVFWRRDGSAFPVAYNAMPIRKDGVAVGVVTTFSDIRERRRAEAQLRKLSAAVNQSPVSVIITDAEGRIEYVNAAFERLSGYAASDVVGENPRLLKSPATPPEVYADLWAALLDGRAWQGEFSTRRRDGSELWERAHISPVKDQHGKITHYLALKEDITTEHAQARLIRYQAEFDSLTGIPNRALTLDRIHQLINQARRNRRRVGLLFIDLDDFKKINDTLGHDVGDKLLIEAATRFSQVIRDGDTVGRLGGDEFLIVLDDIAEAQAAERVASEVLARFAVPFRIADMDLVVTASIGIALYPDDGDAASLLLRNADTAMYSAKDAGRNTFSFFAPAMNRAAADRLEMERNLHAALDNREFRLEFQPQIDPVQRRVIGAEALLRWSSPALGEVFPGEFIGLTEQTGQIVAIGAWVIDEACRALQDWRSRVDPLLRVAVNVSPRQFKTTHAGLSIADIVAAALERHQLPAACLELEVTEGLLIKNWDNTRPLLESLHRLGVRIALDDFGTGYSSLAYLRSFPFDILKIDQGFIRDLVANADDRALVGAILSMAGSLGMTVIAEGVEDAAQLDVLRAHNCPLVQGYHFARPMSAEDFAAFVAAYPHGAG